MNYLFTVVATMWGLTAVYNLFVGNFQDALIYLAGMTMAVILVSFYHSEKQP